MKQPITLLRSFINSFPRTIMHRSIMQTATLSMLLWIVWFASTSNAIAQSDPRKESSRPNILWIMVDDLRPSLGCYQDAKAITPNIDRLAKESRCFLRAYCQQAVCGPSRASILTGRYPDQTHVWHNRHLFRDALPNCKTLPELLKENGYQTLSLGKIFSGDSREEDPQSWSVPAVLRPKGSKNYLLGENQGKGKQTPIEFADVTDSEYPDGKLADLAIETLSNLSKSNQPFFLAVGFFRPHLPFTAPAKYKQLHAIDKFQQPNNQRIQNAPQDAYPDHLELAGYRGIPDDEIIDPSNTAQLRQAYYACVSYVDAQIGRLLESLRKLDLDKNTAIVFLGDHGYSLGETEHWCKATNFELDTRVPLIIRTPDLPQPGQPTKALVESVDLYPTIIDWLGISSPDALQGSSLVNQLNNPTAPGKKAVLTQFARPFKPSEPEVMGYSLRTDEARFTQWIDFDTKSVRSEELYLYSDHENTLAGSITHPASERENILQKRPELAEELRLALDTMLKQRKITGDPNNATPSRSKKKKPKKPKKEEPISTSSQRKWEVRYWLAL